MNKKGWSKKFTQYQIKNLTLIIRYTFKLIKYKGIEPDANCQSKNTISLDCLD